LLLNFFSGLFEATLGSYKCT